MKTGSNTNTAKGNAKSKAANRKPQAKATVPKVNGEQKVTAGAATTGPFPTKIWAMAKEPISRADLRKKAEAAKLPTPGWKIGDMLKRGQLGIVR